MIVNEQNEVIEVYDLDLGYLEPAQKNVEYSYVVDEEEEYEWVVIQEYPETGGKDVEKNITKPEVGHWKVVDTDTQEDITESYDKEIPEYLPKDVPTPDIYEYNIYKLYTEEELAERAESKRNYQRSMLKSQQMPTAISMFVNSTPLPRQQAISVSTFYNEWSGKRVEYEKDQYVQYNDDLYHVELNHTSQDDWTPDVSPSLYTRFRLDVDGIRIWETPTHSENAFDTGEKCHYPDAGDTIYISKIDGNTTVPGSDDRYWEVA